MKLSKIRNNISQAYLFSGPKGSGKFEAALKFAKRIRNREDSLAVDSDLIILSPEIEEIKSIGGKTKIREKDIKVEHIREIIRKISLTSSGKEKKAVIIKNAEKMTAAAQNALLKTLEEPPENSVLIIIADDRSRLLPTVLSRCQRINFNLISDEKIDFLLRENHDFISRLIQGDLKGKLELAEELGKNLPEAISKMRILEFFLRKKITGKNTLGYFPQISPQKALFLQENLEKSRALLESTNANARLVLENFFLKV